ncbi:MAG: methyltransferase domain-containing protein [Candidatus Hodarchaeales archaeon]|jgi:magnesium-protoporphyrin O-methyltransferase
MICPQCQGIEQTFNQKTAQKELRDFRKKGARKQTRFLLDAIMAEGMKETLLDIGGGVGTIQHELLRSGMSQAINVDASSAYSAAAKEEAERLEHADRISFHQGDFVDVASQIPPTDVVTLDRVICCYHNMEGLVASSSRWMKPLFSMFNFVQKIMRKTFRVFIHKRRDIVAILDTENFESYYYKKAGIWQIEAFKRQL